MSGAQGCLGLRVLGLWGFWFVGGLWVVGFRVQRLGFGFDMLGCVASPITAEVVGDDATPIVDASSLPGKEMRHLKSRSASDTVPQTPVKRVRAEARDEVANRNSEVQLPP